METIYIDINEEQKKALEELLPYYMETEIKQLFKYFIAEAYRNYKIDQHQNERK